MTDAMKRIRRFFRGEVIAQGDRYLIVPGRWRFRIHRHRFWRWRGFRRVTIWIDRPGPARSRHWRLGPFWLRSGPTMSRLERRAR